MPLDPATFEAALTSAKTKLLAGRTPRGHWDGHLSSSALSTATAACALELCRRAAPDEDAPALAHAVRDALGWIATHQNDDGGWGDTTDSPSNISTTVLCWAAMNIAGDASDLVRSAESKAEDWLTKTASGTSPPHLTKAIGAVYGKDRTFAAPILTMCALAGRFGTGRSAWCHIAALPFELAACPHQLFRWLRLSVVSYALPALIAIGQARHYHRPTRNPITRVLRNLTRGTTLRVLRDIQPSSGGFLQAAPLTSFVLMSLASIGQVKSTVARRAKEFLTSTVREDGSWPIDTNLSTWLTTLSVNALAGDGDLARSCPDENRARITMWLREQQYTTEHPYTHAAPGGWAWTDLSGGVPDADDTAGALLAIYNLHSVDHPGKKPSTDLVESAAAGIKWLIDLQNTDGGIPTFCRGWGKLPFDQSSPDLTAHALRAFAMWHEHLPSRVQSQVAKSMNAALGYLLDVQQGDGSFVPLWFGNQCTPGQTNPVYGTSRVLCVGCLAPVEARLADRWDQSRSRAIRWLLSAQLEDGGWGGAAAVQPSIEETALAVESLAVVVQTDRDAEAPLSSDETHGTRETITAVRRGTSWLIDNTNAGTQFQAAPIGLYFASLWYWELQYPLVFTVGAWQHARGVLFDDSAHERPSCPTHSGRSKPAR